MYSNFVGLKIYRYVIKLTLMNVYIKSFKYVFYLTVLNPSEMEEPVG